MSTRFKYLFPISLALAWLFDLLFWGKLPGISIPIYVLFLLGAGYWLLQTEGKALPRASLWLLAPVIFFAMMSFLRLEPLTLLLSLGALLFLLALLANTLLNGKWLEYGLADQLINQIGLVPRAFLNSGQSVSASREDSSGWRAWLPYLRGFFIALPILLVFSILLASADLVFSQYLDALFEWLRIENLAELLFRGFYVVVLGVVLAGVYFYAIRQSAEQKLFAEGRTEPSMKLGLPETATVLGLVNLLFAAFVVVQIRYFFGGSANIAATGFTYAEYARRGFGEMTVVALFALLLFLVLGAITRRDKELERKIFSGMSVSLLLLVGVILFSAYQRLLLYESAYGFTRLRTYSHVFMIWLGLLLAAAVWLQIRGRGRYVTAAILLAGLGFAASLNLLNVDAFITRANFQRAEFGYAVDRVYLFGQPSEDAVPALAEIYQAAVEAGDQEQADSAAVVLICHAWRHDYYQPELPWQSFNLSRYRAAQHWEKFAVDGQLTSYQIDESDDAFMVFAAGEAHDCGEFVWFD